MLSAVWKEPYMMQVYESWNLVSECVTHRYWNSDLLFDSMARGNLEKFLQQLISGFYQGSAKGPSSFIWYYCYNLLEKITPGQSAEKLKNSVNPKLLSAKNSHTTPVSNPFVEMIGCFSFCRPSSHHICK